MMEKAAENQVVLPESYDNTKVQPLDFSGIPISYECDNVMREGRGPELSGHASRIKIGFVDYLSPGPTISVVWYTIFFWLRIGQLLLHYTGSK